MQYTFVHDEPCGEVFEVVADSDEEAVEKLEDVVGRHMAEAHPDEKATPDQIHEMVEGGTHRFDEEG